MPDTTPADRPADQLRAAAELLRAARFSGAITATPTVAALIGARMPLARWLESWSGVDLSEHGPMPEDAQHALAVARQLLGTSAAVGVTPSADRRDRYAAAIREADGWVLDDGQHMIDAVMAVADAEQASLRAEAEGLDEALRGAISAAEKAVVPPAPADRAATRDRIRQAICEASGFTWLPDELMEPDEYGEHADAVLAVLADDAAAGVQPPTTTADRAAALGMTPTEYRQHSHTTAVQQIQAAAQGLFAGTAIRVADALKEPATPPAASAAPEERAARPTRHTTKETR
ncbi:hypothetical protein [Streptomyces parvus]|uniref:hypothetical protein n=1 Tax=Streptomyces parvus TaxID=66428 RepID=UPI003324BF9F